MRRVRLWCSCHVASSCEKPFSLRKRRRGLDGSGLQHRRPEYQTTETLNLCSMLLVLHRFQQLQPIFEHELHSLGSEHSLHLAAGYCSDTACNSLHRRMNEWILITSPHLRMQSNSKQVPWTRAKASFMLFPMVDSSAANLRKCWETWGNRKIIQDQSKNIKKPVLQLYESVQVIVACLCFCSQPVHQGTSYPIS